jgi:hypothetical protein
MTNELALPAKSRGKISFLVFERSTWFWRNNHRSLDVDSKTITSLEQSGDITQLRCSLNVPDDCEVCPGDACDRYIIDRATLQRLSATFASITINAYA